MRAADAEGASGRIFNVAAGSPASVNTVAETIGRIVGKPVERTFAPPRPGDIRDSWADVARREGRSRLPAVGRSRRGPAAHGRVILASDGRVEGPPRDRAAQRRRAGTARRLSHGRPRRARLRHDARRRHARARRGVDGLRRRRQGRVDRGDRRASPRNLAVPRPARNLPARAISSAASARRSCTRTRRRPAPSDASPRCSPATHDRRSSSTRSTGTCCAGTSTRS